MGVSVVKVDGNTAGEAELRWRTDIIVQAAGKVGSEHTWVLSHNYFATEMGPIANDTVTLAQRP